MKIEKIMIRGVKLALAPASVPADDHTQLRASYLISAPLRGLGETHVEDLAETDLVELVFEDDTRWFANGDTLDELFPEAARPSRAAGGAFEIPLVLRGTDATRSLAGDVLLKALHLFTKRKVGEKVRDLAAELEKKQLEDKSGLYGLDASFQLQAFRPGPTQGPYLLLLHGTASSTQGSFGHLVGTGLWQYLRQTYGDQVLAFQHETLTKSPLENTLDLVRQLPDQATLHLLSHSRGGLVGDILSRWSSSAGQAQGFDENEMAYLEKEDRTRDQDHIRMLQAEMQRRQITVARFIRVACPAGGTVLASRRLDNFFNVALNLIGYGTGLATSPVYTVMKNLIAAVIDSKNEPDLLPGLEAMNPGSPFIKVLNNPISQVLPASPLLVLAGNCQVKLNRKALVVITSKLFFLQDNDLVVNTRSMYQGTRRLRVYYALAQTAEVDHFHYFQHKATTRLIQEGLQAAPEVVPAGFRLLPPVLPEAERQALLGLEGGQVFQDAVTGTRPIVVVVPGFLGSSLKDGNSLLWINYLRVVTGGLAALGNDLTGSAVKAPGLIATAYKKLVKYLSVEYDVVTLPFDWRRHLPDQAELLKNKIAALLTYGQPVRIVAHSMGGVLVREFMLRYPEAWQRLNQSAGFRLLFLGAPLGGSFRIPAVLFGQDTIINKLSKIDIINTRKELLAVFSRLPGLLGLLPLTTDPDNDFAAPATWERMRQAFGDATWPLPAESQLQAFKAYRDHINRQLHDIDYSHAVYLAGKGQETPCGYRIEQTRKGLELVFLSTAEGDQSVTWESGIPKKMLAAQSVYYADVVHGSLANEPRIFKAIAEILAKGYTHALRKTPPVVRGEEKIFKRPLQHDFDLSPAGLESTLLDLAPETGGSSESAAPLRVSVSNGNLRYASHLVLAGHFRHDGILYAEAEIDFHLRQALSERHRLGIYPGEIGSSEIFVARENSFKGALIVGLGDFGALTAFQLAQTVEQGITKYLLTLNSQALWQPAPGGAAGDLGISSLIIGCGYGGLTVENSVRSIIQGVVNANEKVRRLHEGGARTIQHIEFVELYEDTALSCFYALSRIETEENGALAVAVDSRQIRTLLGARKRLAAEATEGWWNRITVLLRQEQEATHAADIRCLLFSASTGGAREDQRELYTSTSLVEQLVEEISTNNNWSPELAKTVFELLVPNDFKEQLKKHGHITWVLDKTTAAYPWELLQDKAGDARPLCVNAGMIRQLATPDSRLRINAVATTQALVVGEPELDGFLVPLEGAQQEGRRVAELLRANGYQTTACLRSRATEIIQSLLREDYKIIHLAGHGVFDADHPANSGMVIGKNVYLSTLQINQMSTVPELVFVNCCYLGKTDAVAEAYYRSRYKLAANIGTQLIENGVKAVVVAGWAVDDQAALLFTEVFYTQMFAGATFGEAVLKARYDVYARYGNRNNTWGAYQCYGNQYYKFKSSDTRQQQVRTDFVIAEQAEIELHNLHNELDTGRYSAAEYLERLEAIARAVDQAGIRNAGITEKEASIYADLYAYGQALVKFRSLLEMEKASFSVATLEKYNNIRAKKCVYDFIEKKKLLADAPGAGPAIKALSKQLLGELEEVIQDLRRLVSFSPTAERLSLLGSAFKRKALIYFGSARAANPKVDAYTEAAYYYQKAYATQPSPYALTNWYTLESILVLLDKRAWGQEVSHAGGAYLLPDPAAVVQALNQARQTLPAAAAAMDYWDMAALANLELCRLLVAPPAEQEEQAWDGVLALYRELWNQAGSKGKKMAEIEHLECLADALAQVDKRQVGWLRDRVGQLRHDLEVLV